MGLLSESEITNAIEGLPGWNFSDNEIWKEFTFDSYMEGIAFVNRLAEEAEAQNHHPDLIIGWCRVRVAFTSHDQGGVTDQCIAMAAIANAITA